MQLKGYTRTSGSLAAINACVNLCLYLHWLHVAVLAVFPLKYYSFYCFIFVARELNCSTECKWDNGIGYAVYPGDCSMFVQCDSIHGQPLVQQCPWGLLWSIDMLQCTYPHMSECGKTL